VKSPLFDVVLALHVASGLAGFGSLALTGRAAAAVGRIAGAPGAALPERARRYFRAGVNWPERMLLLVPVFGAALIVLDTGDDATKAWPWIGLGLWVAATGVASSMVWPGERAIQAALAGGQLPAEASGLAELRRRCQLVERGTAITTVVFVAALAVMIVQPG
jgi:hypothetical protein